MNQTKPITDSIRRNNLPLFSRSPVREKSRTQLQVSSLKNDCSLFSRLFIASQMRDGDLDDFFAHENQACAPALSQMGKMRLGTKSDLVGCLEDMIPSQENVASPHVEVIILVVRRPSPTMQHRFSCRISHPSYIMRSEWMSSGMNTCQTV